MTYDRLARGASVRQTTVGRLVAPLLIAYAPPEEANASPSAKIFVGELSRLVNGIPVDGPQGPPIDCTYSREDIYFDHD